MLKEFAIQIKNIHVTTQVLKYFEAKDICFVRNENNINAFYDILKNFDENQRKQRANGDFYLFPDMEAKKLFYRFKEEEISSKEGDDVLGFYEKRFPKKYNIPLIIIEKEEDIKKIEQMF